jgi:hypothetical protein
MQGAVQKKREQMKKEKLLRLAGLIGAMFVLLACSVFSSVAPTASVTPTEVVTSTVELPASTATAIATSIPAVQEPTIVIRLGPGKYAQPIWLEVLTGEYKLTNGVTLLAGSAIGVYTESLTFPSGMAIEIGDGGLELMGVSYDAGTQLVVDSSGNLVPSAGTNNGDTSASNGAILFEGDFSSKNAQGWRVGDQSNDYGNLNIEMIDDQYIMTLTGKEDYYFVITSIPDFSAKDFVLSMDVTVLESKVKAGNLSFELSVREADGVNGRHYSFSLFNDGTSSGEVWPTKKYEDIITFWGNVPNSAISFKEGVTNTISLEANDSTFTLYVNGQKIDEVTDATINEAGNISINLGLYKPNEILKIVFENLTITAIP